MSTEPLIHPNRTEDKLQSDDKIDVIKTEMDATRTAIVTDIDVSVSFSV